MGTLCSRRKTERRKNVNRVDNLVQVSNVAYT